MKNPKDYVKCIYVKVCPKKFCPHVAEHSYAQACETVCLGNEENGGSTCFKSAVEEADKILNGKEDRDDH